MSFVCFTSTPLFYLYLYLFVLSLDRLASAEPSQACHVALSQFTVRIQVWTLPCAANTEHLQYGAEGCVWQLTCCFTYKQDPFLLDLILCASHLRCWNKTLLLLFIMTASTHQSEKASKLSLAIKCQPSSVARVHVRQAGSFLSMNCGFQSRGNGMGLIDF